MWEKRKDLVALSLNICHGGGSRVQRIFDWLMSVSAGLILLPEWRNNLPGERLKQSFEDNGYKVTTAAQKNRNGILVATKDATIGSRRITPMCSERGELLLVEISGLKILAGYFPQGKAKAPFFSACLAEVTPARTEPFLLIGDLNTGSNHLDVEGVGARFACAKQFQELQTNGGLSDLWRAEHGERREWTWRSSKNGFRVDHALANASFRNLFPSIRCLYDHWPRESHLSDHSALILQCVSEQCSQVGQLQFFG